MQKIPNKRGAGDQMEHGAFTKRRTLIAVLVAATVAFAGCVADEGSDQPPEQSPEDAEDEYKQDAVQILEAFVSDVDSINTDEGTPTSVMINDIDAALPEIRKHQQGWEDLTPPRTWEGFHNNMSLLMAATEDAYSTLQGCWEDAGKQPTKQFLTCIEVVEDQADAIEFYGDAAAQAAPEPLDVSLPGSGGPEGPAEGSEGPSETPREDAPVPEGSTAEQEEDAPVPSEEQGRDEPTASTEGGTRSNPLPLGTGFMIEDWRVTILSVEHDAWSQINEENQFNDPPAEGHQFVMFRLSATYEGAETGDAWLDLGWVVVGSKGNTFNDHCGVIPDPLSEQGEAYPGATVEGNECVSVPSDQLDGATLRIGDSWGEEQVFVDLEAEG